ncbi:hypothetical protein [Dyella psychrodurans]|uniref:hypothetical protein n=1 Tax=Dyella psychrodurans TaxID=1927960 RepID=UPI0011C05670|nr:hypothetical protein [Dyella psychrodurans]
MTVTLQPLLLAFLLTIGVCGTHAQDVKPLPSQDRLISSIDLSQSLGAKSSWRFMALQGPDTTDPVMMEPLPGKIRLCVTRDGGASCYPGLDHLLRLASGDDSYSDPRYLIEARIVRPRADRSLLLMQVASQHSVDGDQRLATVVLAYDQVQESFTPVYEKQINKNNNQEIRYIADASTNPLCLTLIHTFLPPECDRSASEGVAHDYRQGLKSYGSDVRQTGRWMRRAVIRLPVPFRLDFSPGFVRREQDAMLLRKFD